MYDTLHQSVLAVFALIGFFASIVYLQNKLKAKYSKFDNFFGILAMVVFLGAIIWFTN